MSKEQSTTSTTETLTQVNKTPADQPTKTEQPFYFNLRQIGHFVAVAATIAAAALSTTRLDSVQSLEREAQSLLFRVRGSVTPPENVVILAIDTESLVQLSGWPLRRAVYAQVIEKVMQAGAKSVAVDVLWDLPSSYGLAATPPQDCSPNQQISEDDRQLATVLQRYDGKVTLAVKVDQLEGRQWEQGNIALPYCPFQTAKVSLGSVMFPVEVNDRVHRLGRESLRPSTPEEVELLESVKLSSFAEATLQAAGVRYPQPQGDNIFFYGSLSTFEHPDFGRPIPFWYVLSPENWNSTLLQNGRYFKDKIVLIGPTDPKLNDTLNTPFGLMPGVEIHANAIATLLENKSIRAAFPNPIAASGLVLLVVGVGAVLQTRVKHPINRLLCAGAIAVGWGSVCYIAFTQNLLILPMGVPVSAIVFIGFSYFGTGVASERLSNQRIRKTLKRYAGSPLVGEIISHQDDLKDLLRERELEIANKTLRGHYKIDKVLASGGFGETYIAKDLHQPSHPECVVKQLHPVSNNPNHLRLARRMFQREAEILERLGKKHDQIPRLLAYFEEDEEFYLVQEFIQGSPLSEEFFLGRRLDEARVANVLKEILQILHFVHEEHVIHRDVKPSNIIKRQSDGKLVLIDFGAVKDQYNQLAIEETQTNLTVGIGTQGYMAPEQGAGRPQPNSDIYAVGMMGIQALTGLPPTKLQQNPETKEIAWQDQAEQVSSGLANILSKMVQYDYRNRYQSALEVLQDLKKLSSFSSLSLSPENLSLDGTIDTEVDTMTRPWPETFGSGELPPTEPPPK